MRTLKLTAKDFKTVDGCKEYTGKEDLTNFEGNLEFEADLGWMKFGNIKVSGYILIEAGSWIEAGSSIEAVNGGITCGQQLTCKGLLKFKLRLFAGVSPYSCQENANNTVTCGKLEGNVVYGKVVETGLPDEPKETITIGGIEYDKEEVEQRLKDIKPVK